jgi:centrosomal protein CEP290
MRDGRTLELIELSSVSKVGLTLVYPMLKYINFTQGEYGLSQAVQEIKDLKANLRLRDEKIEGLTSQVNQLGIAVNDSETENEELRERLGLDPKEPLDTDAIKEKKLIKTQQQAALNRVLSKEVCW